MSETVQNGVLSYHYHIAGPSFPMSYSIFGSAGFSDMITIGGYTGSGFIEYDVFQQGCCSEDSGPFYGGFQLFLNGNLLTFGIFPPTHILVPFTAGVPVPLELRYVGHSATLALQEALPFGERDKSYGIEAIKVFDAAGNPISDYSLTSALGNVYPAVGSVPEPASITLFATVAGVFILLRRTKKSACR
jgi:hypothetical protein